MKSVEEMDAQCLDFNHDFPLDEMYDEDGEPYHREAQLAVQCAICGETMLHSLQRMSETLRNMISAGGKI